MKSVTSSVKMNDNQTTFPILNVITENLRLSHGHQPSSAAAPHRGGGGGGRGSGVHSEDASLAGKSLKPVRIIKTRGTSVGVDNDSVKLLHRGTAFSNSQGCIHRDSATVRVENDSRHYCAKHRNSFQDETSSNGLSARNSDSKSLCEFSSVNGGSRKSVTDSDRLKVQLQNCDQSALPQMVGPRPIEIRPFQPDRPVNNRTINRDGVSVNRCHCRYSVHDVVGGTTSRVGRINSLPTDIPNVRSRFLPAKQLPKASHVHQDLDSKVDNSGCKRDEIQSPNPLYAAAAQPNSKSASLGQAKAELCFGNGKLQDMMTCWWRYAPIARVLPAW